MINRNQLMESISKNYGSKKGLLKYFYYEVMDKVFNSYADKKAIKEVPSRVVFICKGNICRSAYAEWLFRSKSSFEVCSFGLDTTTGKLANSRISHLSSKLGVFLAAHRTTNVTEFKPKAGDLYVCVEPSHLKKVETLFGPGSTLLLGALCSKSSVYIHDPYSASDEYASSCLSMIGEAVNKLQVMLALKAEKTVSESNV